MPRAGDIVLVDFVGATGVKRRPAVVVSTDTYHAHRPDVVLCLLTTHLAAATAPTDYILQDWAAAPATDPSTGTHVVGGPGNPGFRRPGHFFDLHSEPAPRNRFWGPRALQGPFQRTDRSIHGRGSQAFGCPVDSSIPHHGGTRRRTISPTPHEKGHRAGRDWPGSGGHGTMQDHAGAARAAAPTCTLRLLRRGFRAARSRWRTRRPETAAPHVSPPTGW